MADKKFSDYANNATPAANDKILFENAAATNSFNTTYGQFQAGITATGNLDSGSITSGFGAIDNGASNITTTGTITGNDINVTNELQVGGNVNIATGQTYQINGTQISSADLSNDSNIAKVDTNNNFTTTQSVTGAINATGSFVTDAAVIIDGNTQNERFRISADDGSTYMGITPLTGGGAQFRANGAICVVMSASNVLSSPAVRDSVEGATANIRINPTTGTMGIISSNYRIKENFDYDVSPDDIYQLKPVYFNFKEGLGEVSQKYLGFEAEHTASVNSSFGEYGPLGKRALEGEDPETITAVNYDSNAILAACVKTIQSQKEKIDELENRINLLEASNG